MNKTLFKIFISFVFMSSVISIMLLIINFLGFAYIGRDSGNFYENSPKKILNDVSENLKKNDKGYYIKDKNIIPKDSWCILLNDKGDIIWQQNKPSDIPNHYSINDIAKMAKWFLNDYPVYMQTEDYGLIIFGSPKDAVGKYNVEYTMEWFKNIPQRILMVLSINICLAAILAYIFGNVLYKRLKMLLKGIKDLKNEKSICLKEKGIFKELCRNINETSNAIERKNIMLSQREKARSDWISGISHDIRTPLSVIMGYTESLQNCGKLSDENIKKTESMLSQCIKIKRLIEDLNLISSLEYDMQPSRKKPVAICPLIRKIVSDIINSGIGEGFNISINLCCEKATVSGDENLLERGIFNIINNSIVHNKEGCNIDINEYVKNNSLILTISDNGCGVDDSVLKKISEIPKSAHGLGLPMAYKIINAHNGKMTFNNFNGFVVIIELPLI